MYACSKCGLAVIVTPDDQKIKACDCKAPITLSLEAPLAGKGGMKA